MPFGIERNNNYYTYLFKLMDKIISSILQTIKTIILVLKIIILFI